MSSSKGPCAWPTSSRASPKHMPTTISWPALHSQFGQGYGRLTNFRRDFTIALKEVLTLRRSSSRPRLTCTRPGKPEGCRFALPRDRGEQWPDSHRARPAASSIRLGVIREGAKRSLSTHISSPNSVFGSRKMNVNASSDRQASVYRLIPSRALL